MVAAVAAAASLACTTHAGLGTITYRRGTVTHVLDLTTCKSRTVRGAATSASPVLVSADGRFKAAVRQTGSRRTLRDAIVVNGRAVYSARASGDTIGLGSPGPIELVGWSGDDRWIFFAIDPGGSASIAADGLILRVVARSGSVAHRIATMLVYRDYLTWCGGRLVFTGGGDRIATNGKRLLVASPPSWRPRPLVAARDRAWGSLTCAPGGRSVTVQSQVQSTNASFFATHWALWRVGLDGSRTQLTSPPAQDADESPRYSRDGSTLMFVRSHKGVGKLYALRAGTLLGPLIGLGFNLGFYGHQDLVAEDDLVARRQTAVSGSISASRATRAE